MNISMKGQPRAVEMARAYVGSLERGGPIRPTLLHGPAGTGKTFLANQILNNLEGEGFSIYNFQAPEVCRTIVDCDKTFARILRDGERAAVLIDEAHLVVQKGNGISGAVSAAFKSALFGLGERMPCDSKFPLWAEKDVRIDWTNLALILATNTPERMEERSSLVKGEYPFRRRLRQIELSLYSPEIIGEVISDFLGSRGLQAADCSRGIIGRFHRGSLEAISDVIGAYIDLFPEHKVLSRERVLEAAKLTTWFPRGLNRAEVRLLNALRVQGGSIRRPLAAATIGASNASMVGAVAHLVNQSNDASEPCPFVNLLSGTVAITPAGSKYLKAVREAGFTL